MGSASNTVVEIASQTGILGRCYKEICKWLHSNHKNELAHYQGSKLGRFESLFCK